MSVNRWQRRSTTGARTASSLSSQLPSGTANIHGNQENDLESTPDISSDLDKGPRHSSMESNLVLLATAAAETDIMPCKTDQGTQTEAPPSAGPLLLLLSATDGCHAVTQVMHPAQSHKVTGTDGNWRRQCGFQGYN